MEAPTPILPSRQLARETQRLLPPVILASRLYQGGKVFGKRTVPVTNAGLLVQENIAVWIGPEEKPRLSFKLLVTRVEK